MRKEMGIWGRLVFCFTFWSGAGLWIVDSLRTNGMSIATRDGTIKYGIANWIF